MEKKVGTMPLGASGKFDKYKKEQKNVPIVVNGVEMGSYQLHDNEIDAPDIPKKYREQYRHNLQRTQQYNGDAPLTPRRAWEAEQRVQKQERAEAQAKREQVEKAKYEAKRQRERDAAAFAAQAAAMQATETTRARAQAEEDTKSVILMILVFTGACVVLSGLVYLMVMTGNY